MDTRSRVGQWRWPAGPARAASWQEYTFSGTGRTTVCALAISGRRLLRPPGLEELQELLAGSVLVPLAVPANDLDEMVDGGLLVAGGKRNGKVETRLMIRRVVLDPRLEFSQVPQRRSLLGQLDGGLCRSDRGSARFSSGTWSRIWRALSRASAAT